jgi:hypothetical protein
MAAGQVDGQALDKHRRAQLAAQPSIQQVDHLVVQDHLWVPPA